MSNYAPGWYPDGSGRYAQRYYDGSSWTEHVLDATGQRANDPVPGVTVPLALAPAAPSPAPPPHQQRWGQPAAAGGGRYQPSIGTSSGSFQFGDAPTPERAYASPSTASPSAPTAGTGRGFRPTVGGLVAAAGLVLVALAVLALGYWSGGGVTASLGDISGANTGVDGLVTTYANAGRWLGLAAMVGIVVVAGVDSAGAAAVVDRRRPISVVTAAVGGLLALWHLVGLFLTPDVGVDVGPAAPAFLGVVGYAAGAVSGFLRQPLGGGEC